MNIGLVTTWFERGASYVSRQIEQALCDEHDVFIYARGEEYAKNDKNWDRQNVYWSSKISSPLSYYIRESEFKRWIKKNKIDVAIFNEQRYWPPVLWAAELGVVTIAYIDYYTEETLPFFACYDALICNTRKHFQAMEVHQDAYYIPWGTDVGLFSNFSPKLASGENIVTFFHSAGMNPYRKGTDLLIESFYDIYKMIESKLIIHTQIELSRVFGKLKQKIEVLQKNNKLTIITKTVPAPGLYHLGDVYVYPSRLDGLGLTIAEACSSGLIPLVTDDAPMNEFISDELGYSIKVDKRIARKDGYYWPQSIICKKDLSQKLIDLSNKKKLIEQQKVVARKIALRDFNWNKNSVFIETIIKKTKSKNIYAKKEIIEAAKKVDHKKYPFIHKIHPVYSLLYRILK